MSIDSDLDSLINDFSEDESEVSTLDDIIAGLRRGPGLITGFGGNIESLGRMGINLLRSDPPTIPGQPAGTPGTTPLPPLSANTFLPTSEETTGFIEKNLGISQKPPVTGPGRIAELVGTGGLFGLLRGGIKIATRKATENLTKTLAKPAAAESLIGLGAGGAREGAATVTDDPIALFAAEALGGVGAGGTAQFATRAGRGAKELASTIGGFPKTTIGGVELPTGAANIAADTLRSAMLPDDNLAHLVQKPDVPQTVADQLNNPNLKSIEKKLSVQGDGRSFQDANSAIERAANLESQRVDAIGDLLEVSGDPSDFTKAINSRMKEMQAKIHKGIDRKNDKARKIFDNTGEEGPLTVLSIEAKNTIDERLRLDKIRENDLWETAKPSAQATDAEVQPVIDHMNGLIQDQSDLVSPELMIPDRIVKKVRALGSDASEFQIIGAPKKTGRESLFDLQALRSDILFEARKAKTEGKGALVRHLNLMQEKILDVMDKGDVDGLLKSARIQSHAINDTYRRGEIGKIRGFVGDAEEAISPMSTLDAILSPNAAGDQSERVTEFLRAAGPEGQGQIESFMKRKFRRVAFNDAGDIDIAAAGSFLRNNEGVLEQFPPLRDELTNAVSGARRLANNATQRSKTLKAVSDRGQASRIFGADVDQFVDEAFRGADFRKNPTEEIRRLMKLAKTPEEKAGLTRAMFNWSARKSMKESQEGVRRLDFKKFQSQLDQLSKSGAFRGDQLSRLSRMKNEMQRIANLRKKSVTASFSLQDESMLTDIFASVLGARLGGAIGGKTGGGSIQAAGRVAGLSRRLVSRLDQSKIISLLEEALYDPEVFKTVMMRTTKDKDLIAAGRLRGHLLDMNNDLQAIEEQQ